MSASPELLGYVAAAAPLVSVISPTLSGWLADTWAAAGAKTPYSRVYLATLTLATLGNALQSVSKSVFSLGASRVLIGLSTGSVSVGLGYIMRELPHLDERTAVVNIFSGVEMMGYIIGTALGGVLSTADGSFLGLTVNGFNAPTLVSTAAALLLLLFGLPGFAARERKLRSSTPTKSELASKQASNQKTAAAAAASTGEPSSSGGSKHRAGVSGMGPDKQQQHSGDDSGDDDVEPPPPPPFPHPKSSAEIRPSSTSLSSLDQPVRHHHHRDRHRHHDRHRRPKPFTLGLIIAMYCLVAAMYNALETTASPLTNRFFQWGVKENAMLWTGSGVLGTAVSLGLGHLPPELLRPSDLLAAALGMAVAGPLLMAASLTRELAATDTLGPPTGPLGPATEMAAKAAVVVAEAAQASLGAGKGGEGGEGQEEEGVRQRRWSVAMFLAGFVLFDIGYVVVESMLTILFAAAIEQRQSEPDVDENDDGSSENNDDDDDDDGSENKQSVPHHEIMHEMERDDGEGHEAFYFGVFTSAGWFLGCALGAVAGNHLFLVSAHALLTGCSGTAAGVALLLFACRRHVLTDMDGGRLFAHLEKVLDKGFALRPRCGGIGSGRLAAPASCSPAFSPSLSCTSNNEGRGGAASSMASLELNRDTCGSDKDPPCQNAS